MNQRGMIKFTNDDLLTVHLIECYHINAEIN